MFQDLYLHLVLIRSNLQSDQKENFFSVISINGNDII